MRTARLLNLLQILRQSRTPVSGHDLARELGTSIRTLYRDIATLQAEGADIEGSPGVGYVLNKGFFLPPLMFSEEEMLALMLGMKWVSGFGDRPLSQASKQVLAKVERVVPEAALDAASAIPFGIGEGPSDRLAEEDLSDLRDAIRRERKLRIIYQKPDLTVSERIIWPIAIGYFSSGRVLVGWCETSRGFRHFRTDRIQGRELLQDRMSKRRTDLMKEWRSRRQS